jgi:hypothetical protein
MNGDYFNAADVAYAFLVQKVQDNSTLPRERVNDALIYLQRYDPGSKAGYQSTLPEDLQEAFDYTFKAFFCSTSRLHERLPAAAHRYALSLLTEAFQTLFVEEAYWGDACILHLMDARRLVTDGLAVTQPERAERMTTMLDNLLDVFDASLTHQRQPSEEFGE